MNARTSYAARSSLPEAAEEERAARAVRAVAPPHRASCRDAAAWVRGEAEGGPGGEHLGRCARQQGALKDPEVVVGHAVGPASCTERVPPS